ncbi:MAG: hypothetical protein JWN42_2532 [Candidatus Angelobacter sp.]|nr:hypothetical protein [Candidatus Angelobacter sp.]
MGGLSVDVNNHALVVAKQLGRFSSVFLRVLCGKGFDLLQLRKILILEFSAIRLRVLRALGFGGAQLHTANFS